MKKPNQHHNFPNNGWICQVWMKTSQMSGCEAFSIQNINEYRNMWLYHNIFWCQPSISSKNEKKFPCLYHMKQQLSCLGINLHMTLPWDSWLSNMVIMGARRNMENLWKIILFLGIVCAVQGHGWPCKPSTNKLTTSNILLPLSQITWVFWLEYKY
jgi:hypothetical protein